MINGAVRNRWHQSSEYFLRRPGLRFDRLWRGRRCELGDFHVVELSAGVENAQVENCSTRLSTPSLNK